MADTDFSSVPKPHVYDLLNRLNASFAPEPQHEKLRAGANYHLLGTMRGIEERDRERFSQPPSE